MTKEDKQLLLKDLSSRIFYHVKIRVDYHPKILLGVVNDCAVVKEKDGENWIEVNLNVEEWNIKPYLRPMSSMTEKEKSELRQWGCLCMNLDDSVQDIGVYGAIHSIPVIDWLNAHHFDYRGLIEMGLALEAPEGTYVSIG